MSIKPLYLGKNLQDLNQMANSFKKPSYSPKMMLKASEKVLQQAEHYHLGGDQENAYVLYMRYFAIINIIKNTKEYKKDKKYYDSMIGSSNCAKCIERAEQLNDELKKRYEEKQALEVAKKLDETEDKQVVETPPQETQMQQYKSYIEQIIQDDQAPEGWISVKKLYKLCSKPPTITLTSTQLSVLLMDVRSKEDFNKCHINITHIINIPSVTPGSLSKHIEGSLQGEMLALWRKRVEFDIIVLVDTMGSSDSFSELLYLKNVMQKWDFKVQLKSDPLFLMGGVREWTCIYPMYLTNLPTYQPDENYQLDDEDNKVDLNEISYNLEYQTPSKKKAEVENSDDSSSDDSGTEVVVPRFDRSTKPASNKQSTVQKTKLYDEEDDDDEMEDVLTTFHQIKLDNDKKQVPQTTKPTQETKKRSLVFTPAVNRSLKPTTNNTKATNEVISNGFSNNTKLTSTNKKVAFDQNNDDDLEKLILEKKNEMNGRTMKKFEEKDDVKVKTKSTERKNTFLYQDYSDDEDDSGDDMEYIRKQDTKQNAKLKYFQKAPQETDSKSNLKTPESTLKPPTSPETKFTRLKPQAPAPLSQQHKPTSPLRKSTPPQQKPKAPPPLKDSPHARILRDHESSSNLQRFHSSPNIAKLQDNAPFREIQQKKRVNKAPTVNRSSKPLEIYEANPRTFHPIWGSTTLGLTGLRNLGNTCYMASIVQCLSACKPLRDFFLNDHYKQEAFNGNNVKLVVEFAVLIKTLWSGQYKSLSPIDFRTCITGLNSMFGTSQHQDAQELLEYLVAGLSEQLNRVRIKSAPAPDKPYGDDEREADRVWFNSKKLEDSVVLDLFRGQYKSRVMCTSCDKISTKFETFTTLSLPIPDTRKCSLADCLLKFSDEEKMTGDSMWMCPGCGCKREASKRIVLWRLPPVLVVHLKRFHYQGIWRNKINKLVSFPIQNLDMARYLSGPKNIEHNQNTTYNLFAVCNHSGTLDGGHYTSVCRNNGSWFKFDDSDVSKVNINSVQSAASYLLFYIKTPF